MPPSGDLTRLPEAIAHIKDICAKSEGRSQFFPFGGSGYKASVTHYFNSSTEISACAVQPGSEEDLQSIVKVIAETRVPFAVKCGGHSTNPGFSSTKGIQIYMVRFNEITVNEKEKLVRVGAGCLFEELYHTLHPYKLNIVGGSGVAGVGVAGWLLGGGYSTKTSQYGLGIDNIEAARLVLPKEKGAIEVSEKKNVGLLHAIRGGGNNFGIITEFTLKAHDQGKYYDFLLAYKGEQYEAVKDAIAKFVEKTDNRANIEAALRLHNGPSGIEKFLTVHCVYDGDFPGDDPFEELTKIEHTFDNHGDQLPEQEASASSEGEGSDSSNAVSGFHIADILRSLGNATYDLGILPEELGGYKTNQVKYNAPMSGQLPAMNLFISAQQGSGKSNGKFQATKQSVDDGSAQQPPEKPKRAMAGISQFPRGRWGNVMVGKLTEENTKAIIKIMKEQFDELEAAKLIEEHGGTRIGIGLWPFTEAMFDNAKPSAWPHKKGEPNCPIIVYFTWEGEDNDAHWIKTMKETLRALRIKVHTLCPSSIGLPYFISTALKEATNERFLYRGNLKGLSQFRKLCDPEGVMDLTGGFRIPLPVSDEKDTKEE